MGEVAWVGSYLSNGVLILGLFSFVVWVFAFRFCAIIERPHSSVCVETLGCSQYVSATGHKRSEFAVVISTKQIRECIKLQSVLYSFEGFLSACKGLQSHFLFAFRIGGEIVYY